MVDAASAFETAIPKDHLLTEKDTRRFQRLFEAQATRSYLYLSLGIAAIAVLLPILLMLAGGYEDHDSMSSYYTIDVWPSRDVLDPFAPSASFCSSSTACRVWKTGF